MRFRLAVVIAVLTAIGVPATASASEIIDRNVERRLAEGRRQRPGARQLQRARQALERPRLGRGERDPADDGPQAGRVQARLLGRVRDLQARRLEDPQERLPRLRRPRAAVVRGRLQGSRRLVLGAAVLAAGAAQLRPAGVRQVGRLGASALALERRAAAADRQPELGLQDRSTTSSGRSPTSGSRSTASSRPPAATRSTRSAATSISTPSTRPTARAGSARTAS